MATDHTADSSPTGKDGVTRECGDCKLCCKLLVVTSLAKPMHQWCSHATSRGCGIYETRPSECENFACSWLAGVLPERFKPNKVKAVVYAHQLVNGNSRIVLHEDPDMPGAYERYPEFKQLMEGVLEKGFEFLIISGKRRRLFKPGSGK